MTEDQITISHELENFKKLNLPFNLLRVIEEKGFKNPTKIQNKSIPQIYNRKNVIVQSATGSGKTLCYTSQIISQVISGQGVQALIIAPTKELVQQIGKEIKEYSKYNPLNVVISYGGGSYKDQLEEIYKADVIVGTTGRISDFVEQGSFELGHLKMVILDEADELFISTQFFRELEFILKQCPKISQKMIFSATIPKESVKFIKHYIKEPKRITGDEYVDPKKLKQVIYQIEQDQKFSFLIHLLTHEHMGLGIIFCNRQDTAVWLGKNLKNLIDYDYEVLHGDTTKGKRTKILENFKNQKFDLLITTDVAARGIDVDNISHIFNYNIPKVADKYIHRVGRTARAGESGKAISLVAKQDFENFIEILKEHDIRPIIKDLPQFNDIEIKKTYVQKKPKR